MRREGVSALNLNEVARRLHVKPPALYKYFDGKSGIYDELFRLAHQTFSEYVKARIDESHGDFWTTWTKVIQAQLEFAYDCPELFELAFQRPVPGFQPSDQSMEVCREVALIGEDLIRQSFDLGEIQTDLPFESVRDLLFAITAGITAGQLANDPSTAPDEGRFGSLAEQAVSVFRSAWSEEKA